MTTVTYENVDLCVAQQGEILTETGMQTLRGALTLNHDEGVARFVEDKRRSYGHNPIFWEGRKLKLRIDKQGKLRGTFCIEVPREELDCELVAEALDQDFLEAVEQIYELSTAQRPKRRKTKRCA